MNKKGLIIILFSIIFVLGFANADFALAGTGHNVSGWGWAINIGWISFNCTNTGTCGTSNYGVDIDLSAGTHTARPLTGYAWSENIGWVRFNPTGPYPSDPQEPSKLNFGNNQITGWARVCAGTSPGDCTGASRTDGWDGWIKMAGANYGVTKNECNLEGYAWGSDVVGWVKFKGSSYGVTLGGPPTATNLQTTTGDYCQMGPHIIVSWQFLGACSSQTAYQIQIDNNSDFSSPCWKEISPSP